VPPAASITDLVAAAAVIHALLKLRVSTRTPAF
jgi:hypothetical protein